MNRAKNKEVYILIILLLVLVVYGFYTLLLSPKMAEAGELKEQVETEDTIVRSMYDAILRYDADAAELQKKQEQTRKLTEQYYIRENQETYLKDLRQMIADCGVDYVKIESENHDLMILIDEEGYRCESPYMPYIDDLTAVSDSDGEIDVSLVLQKVDEISEEIPKIDQMPMEVEVTGAQSAVYKLIEKLETSEKRIISSEIEQLVTSGATTAGGADPQVKATLVIRFARVTEMECLSSEEFPKMPTDFTMPNDFVTGSYRNLFHF